MKSQAIFVALVVASCCFGLVTSAEAANAKIVESAGARRGKTLIELGFAQIANGKHLQAIQTMKSALKVAPKNAEAHFGLANAFHLSGKCKESVAEYSAAIALRPDYISAFNNRGNCFDSLGLKKEAIRDFDHAISLNPKYAIAFNNRATEFEACSEPKRAMQDYNMAITLEPNYVDALSNRGALRMQLHDVEGAIQDCQKAIRINSHCATAYRNLGDALQVRGDYELSAAAFSKVIQLQPTDAYSYCERGYGRLQVGDAGAIRDCLQAVKICPTAYRYYRLGHVYEAMNKWPQAMTAYGKSIELDAKWTKPYLSRSKLRYSSNDYMGSAEDAKKVIELDPADDRGHRELAYALWKIADAKSAEIEFGKAIGLNPSSRAHGPRGLVRTELGDLPGALEDFDQELEIAECSFYFEKRAQVQFAMGHYIEGAVDAAHANCMRNGWFGHD